jgi:hypothetical protein
MATTLEPRRGTAERIVHPLQAVRKYIRSYVLLEGAAYAVLFLAAWFWIGMLLDWGSFAAFSFDWIQELQIVDETQSASHYVRVVLLLVLLGCLIGLAVTKMALRLGREFSDAAVALVLERRFPRELGDRLITAVELADPKQAAQLGYSAPMVERTIQEAGERVERLPVAEVFDWGRLKQLWIYCGLATVGLGLALGIVSMAVGAIAGGSASPLRFLAGFSDTAAIWTERNLLLMDSFWPRSAHLEMIRYQDTPSHPGEMRVGRDEQRPDLLVRAVQWVIADRAAADGWRALQWTDLPALLPNDLLDRVAIPQDFGHWVVDLDDLDPDVPANVVPVAWHGKTSGEVRQAMQQPAVRATLQQFQAEAAVEKLLDWRVWTVDKIVLQEQKAEVRQPLRERHTEAHKALEEVFAALEELAASSSMSRTLRKLEVPTDVVVHYRGENTKVSEPGQAKADYKFSIGLGELQESVRFRVRGGDYWTRPRKITLVPPPSVIALYLDKEEPAYLYHRLQGDQAPLKGKRQLLHDVPISVTGELSTIDVPYGASLTLKAKMDRPLREEIRIRPPAGTLKETGSIVPNVPVERDADRAGYRATFKDVTRTLDFLIEYQDEDGVRGKRRFRIRPLDDNPPELISPEIAAVLRKPRFKSDPGRGAGGVSIDGYLITPDALVPLGGVVRDDHALTKVEWIYVAEAVDIQLTGAAGEGGPAKDRTLLQIVQGDSRLRRSGLIVGGFQVNPLSLQAPAATAYWGFVSKTMEQLLAARTATAEQRAPLTRFVERQEGKAIYETPLTALAAKLKEAPPGPQALKLQSVADHQLKEEDGFDVRLHLEHIKTRDPIKEAQKLYFLRLSVGATDNNVETGPSSSRTKAPFFFLIVSENDLLAQVALEEEVLSERLEKVMQKLTEAKVSLSEQTSRLTSGGDLSLVAIRADAIRKDILDSASVAREVHTDYTRILRELEVNRVGRGKIADVRDKIVLPLEEIINPNYGDFLSSEEASFKFYQAVEDDVSAKTPPRTALHLQNAAATSAELDKLMNKLNDILIAMAQGITEAKTIQNLVLIESDERNIAEALRRFYDNAQLDLLRQLTEPDAPKK